MQSSFIYQLLVSVTLRSQSQSVPVFLREIVKKGDIQDFKRLEDDFKSNIANANLESPASIEEFLFVLKEALSYFFFRKDYEGFTECKDAALPRLSSLKAMGTLADAQPWERFIHFLDSAFERLLRHAPIESFENAINHLDWTGFDHTFISHISTVIGYVYLHETDQEQVGKSRLWLQKAIHESGDAQNLNNHMLLSRFYLLQPSAENRERVMELKREMVRKGEKVGVSGIANLFEAAGFELEVSVNTGSFKPAEGEDAFAVLEESQERLRQLDLAFRKRDNLPDFAKAYIEAIFAELYLELISLTPDDLEQNNFARFGLRYLELSAEKMIRLKDEHSAQAFRLRRYEIAVAHQNPVQEKDIKELLAVYKKSADYGSYLRAVRMQCWMLENNLQGEKINEILLSLFKHAQKASDHANFFVMNGCVKIGNEFFLREALKPGISWMVGVLDQYFDRVLKMIDFAEEHSSSIGSALIRDFMAEYARFEPAAHFNIKVYFRYQWGGVAMLKMAAGMHQDEEMKRVANTVYNEFNNQMNPLSFIRANWEEFRLVPNSVRNKTINKCINISKGDLPLAAEHLDFSYRNLRSYITFKEVNRLGFFLDMQQTNNRQLEQGIRYMFHDLYRNGTIFEVVFDMPKFLVKYAKNGFYAIDMERDLSIKGTTAKKYLKIMTEINLIRQDRTTGRKHFYRLMRENVMNRLGKEQAPLVK
jgi:hypothetical protein